MLEIVENPYVVVVVGIGGWGCGWGEYLSHENLCISLYDVGQKFGLILPKLNCYFKEI